MTTSKTTSRTLRTIAAVAAASMIAAACGGDDTVVKEPTTTDLATTTQPVAPETAPNEEPAADAEADTTVETDAASTTTTTEAEADNGEAAVTDEEPDGVPADEPPFVDVGAASEGTTTPVTTVPSDEAPEPEAEPEPEEEQPQQEAPTAEGSTEDTTSPQPELESEPEPETEQETDSGGSEAESGTLECETLDDGTATCWTEPVEDSNAEGAPVDDLVCETQTDGTTTCWSEPEDETPDNLVCETQTDGTATCWATPEAEVWIAPVAGMVPEVPLDTPLPEWKRGDGTVNPDDRAYDYPRPTQQVLAWTDWCFGVSFDCRGWMHKMYQALDYLGADPQCVLGAYTRRTEYFISQGSGANSSYAANNFGWHVCGTVIDPIVGDLPDQRSATDVGLRLSDTPGVTLAERCRIVLTDPFPDILLEDRHYDFNQTTRFGQDCDAWAAWVQEEGLNTSAPACNESSSLAEEWMEHHHDQHELYHRPHC